MPTEFDNSVSVQSVVETANSAEVTPLYGVLFIAACVILPVIWGVIVHLVFTWLRKQYRSERDGAPTWPDYQI